ncbi:MAG: ATP-dependent Clp protease proteolytic subunit, partial [Candidatus Magasanikbacteria bacterium]|nr:ATP-dependent Clp protease proteolytic subunit [Candidatus Magasanikbacteria bacterium]MBT4350447.1 ATP-dependent Clp protease proteolytic subunit [Candidatus Magasanikbacteria bacterium]MBT4541991.1 ATP-dependent Clp protease proteolytic subunit [Candidatus Magasanikbacteria bacterium]
IQIHAERIIKMKANLNEILAKHSGQTIAQVEKDSDRDYFMSAKEAVSYGLADKVIS